MVNAKRGPPTKIATTIKGSPRTYPLLAAAVTNSTKAESTAPSPTTATNDWKIGDRVSVALLERRGYTRIAVDIAQIPFKPLALGRGASSHATPPLGRAGFREATSFRGG